MLAGYMKMLRDTTEAMREQSWSVAFQSILPPPKAGPDHDLLRVLGAVFLSETTPRVVQIGQTVHEEGGMDAVIDRLSDDQAEAAGKGRSNKTTWLQ